MKRILLLNFILCVVFSARILAALGNSETQLADLYGKPTQQGFPDKNGVTTNMYQNGDYLIISPKIWGSHFPEHLPKCIQDWCRIVRLSPRSSDRPLQISPPAIDIFHQVGYT